MRNDADTKMAKLSRREYNRIYYQKNKNRLQAKKTPTSGAKVLQLFSNKNLRNLGFSTVGRTWLRFRNLELLLLFGLTAVMSYCLVRESAAFYLDAQEGGVSAYLKAGTMEGVAILFSLSRSNAPLLRWTQRVVVVLMCSFTLWIMSGKLLKTSVQENSQVHAMEQVIQDLETQRNQKELLRQEFVNKRWLNMARKYEKGIDQVREKLILARREMAMMPTPKVIMNSLGILLGIRILMVISNLICFHRIAEHFNHGMKQQMVSTPGFSD